MGWKRILGWSFAGIAALLIVAAIGGYLYLRSTSFQRFAIGEIAEKANLATGGKIQIGRLDLDPRHIDGSPLRHYFARHRSK